MPSYRPRAKFGLRRIMHSWSQFQEDVRSVPGRDDHSPMRLEKASFCKSLCTSLYISKFVEGTCARHSFCALNSSQIQQTQPCHAGIKMVCVTVLGSCMSLDCHFVLLPRSVFTTASRELCRLLWSIAQAMRGQASLAPVNNDGPSLVRDL